ncbi:MAG: YeeE/YedE thiosulfate transporter family protein [Hyphomicrobium sp.]|jgi:hypothetical protein
MSVVEGILIGIATGIVFGFALEKSRVFEPGIIVGQMQLRTFVMLKVFLAAVISGLVVLAVLNGVLGVKLSIKPLLWRADIIGGLLLGAGIVIAGACPGTSAAQVGAGYRDALFVIAGGIVGAMFYGYNSEIITGLLAETGEKVTFDGLLNLPFWLVALALAAPLAILLVLLERITPWQAEVGNNLDGLPTAQDAASKPVGALGQFGSRTR